MSESNLPEWEQLLSAAQRFNFLSSPTYLITAIATLLGVAGALFYLYRLLVVTRDMKKQSIVLGKLADPLRVYGGVFYFNRSDSALFVRKYGFNFAKPLGVGFHCLHKCLSVIGVPAGWRLEIN